MDAPLLLLVLKPSWYYVSARAKSHVLHIVSHKPVSCSKTQHVFTASDKKKDKHIHFDIKNFVNHFHTRTILPLILAESPLLSFLSLYCFNLSSKPALLWAINNHFAVSTYHQHPQKCPNNKGGTKNNSNLTSNVQCNFLESDSMVCHFLFDWVQVNNITTLASCCFVAFGYLPNPSNKSELIS